MFVLRSREYGGCTTIWDGYFTGKTYTCLHQKYAVCDTDINKAKKYTSLKRAEKASECMLDKIVNYVFDVMEIEEEEYES